MIIARILFLYVTIDEGNVPTLALAFR